MTISTSASQTTVAGTGAATVFSYGFIAGTSANIQVIYTDASANQTVLSPSTYTLVINAPAAGQIWGVGGTVTYPNVGSPIAAGTTLTIRRIVPLTQTTSISNQGDFYPQSVEQALDTLCLEIQQVSARTSQQRGTWATGLAYNLGDWVVDGANGANTLNWYQCVIANTSGTWATDLASGDWSLGLNVAAIAGYASAASGSATAASGSAVSAAASAASAASSASSATTSAGTASTQATNAGTSATNAATSASHALTSETNASGSAASALTYANNAAGYSTSAAASASSATSSANNAANYSSSAASSASSASNSATSAAASAASAAGYSTSASSSATTATTQATNALTSATNASNSATSAAASAVSAQNYAAALTDTSTSSLAIATGAKTFTCSAGKQFAAGQFVLASSNANSANYMHGQVTSYSGTTLVVNVLDIGGSGTKADWNLSVSGSQGAAGSVVGAALTSAHTYVGNGSNIAADVAISGDVSLNNAGTMTVSKVNGVAYSASPSTNTVPVVTGANTITYETCPVVAGGTGLATLTAHGVVLGNVTGTVNFATIGTSGRLLIDQGASADPSFNAMSGDATITNTGAITITKTNGSAFGTAAIVNTGTSGATIPLLNGANTQSGTWTMSALANMSGAALNEAQGADIASATTTDIGAATGNYVVVTSTTTITGLGTVQAGTRRKVKFSGILTLTHNASSLILPNAGSNITTAAGDVAEFVSLGSGNWICTDYMRASGQALVAGSSGAMIFVGSYSVGTGATFDVTGLASGYDYVFNLDGVYPNGSDILCLRYQTGGSTWQTTSYEYTTAFDANSNNASPTSASLSYITSASQATTYIYLDGPSTTLADGGISGTITLYNPGATNKNVELTYELCNAGSGSVRGVSGGGLRNATGAVTGLRFYWPTASRNFSGGTINVYKIAKA